MLTVTGLRKILHQNLADMEEIDPGDIQKVNTFSRMEIVKAKTRELTALASSFAEASRPDALHLLFDRWDAISIDWVYSDCLEFDGSLADKIFKKIVQEIKKTLD